MVLGEIFSPTKTALRVKSKPKGYSANGLSSIPKRSASSARNFRMMTSRQWVRTTLSAFTSLFSLGAIRAFCVPIGTTMGRGLVSVRLCPTASGTARTVSLSLSRKLVLKSWMLGASPLILDFSSFHNPDIGVGVDFL